MRSLVLLVLVGRLAHAQPAPVIAAHAPSPRTDPCPGPPAPGGWQKLPAGGPEKGEVGWLHSEMNGPRFLVTNRLSGAALELCKGHWTRMPSWTPQVEGIMVGALRFSPGYDPRESSYHQLATAHVTLAGRTVAASAKGAPGARSMHVLAFDGQRLLVWGGWGPIGVGKYGTLGDGAMLDVRTGRWRPMSRVGAPSPRFLPVAAWTGKQLIVWGGGGGGKPGGEPEGLRDGALYDPVADRWTPMSLENTPEHRWKPSAAWTGSHLVIAGGGPSLMGGGARGREDVHVYDPAANRWTPVKGGKPLAENHWVRVFVTRSGKVIFADTHSLGSFGAIDPKTARYEEIKTPDTLLGRSGVAFQWTGERLVVFGGFRQQPGYQDPCKNHTGPQGCDPPSPDYTIFSDGWLHTPR